MDPDRGLVEAAAAGDRNAFDELVQRHQRSMVSLIGSLTGPGVDAEDIAQEVFVRAWRSLGGFRGDSTFRTWLHRIAVNLARSHQSRAGRWRRMFASGAGGDTREDDTVARAPDPGNLEEDVLLRHAIDTALAALPEELRLAVVLRDVQGLDYREIARTLGVPIGTVESRIFRARQRLRPLLAAVRHTREGRSESRGRTRS